MKRVVVVGGTSGIGEKVVELSVQNQWDVTSVSRSGKGENPSVDYISCDVLQEDLPEVEGELHGLVYCPGTINLKPFSQLKEEDFISDWQVNFYGGVRVISHFFPQLKEGKGSIVMISSVAAQLGFPYHASVAAAKGAVEGFVRSLAAEFAPDIRVNAVAPSLTDSPLAHLLLSDEKKRQASEHRHPLKKIGETKDIASMILYLLSDDAKWITGQIFGVDGGISHIHPL